jgi:hypothetical protein
MQPDELKLRVLGAVHNEPSPTRSVVRRREVLMLAIALLALFGVFSAAGGARVESRPIDLIVGTATGAAVLALAAFWSAFGRGGSMLGRPRTILAATTVLAPLCLLAWKLVWTARFPNMLDERPQFVGLRCLGLTLAMSSWPLIALLIAKKGSDPVHPGTSGAALGVAAGAAAWVLTDLWCPVAYPPHLLLGHVLPLVISAIAGALLGKRVIALGRR